MNPYGADIRQYGTHRSLTGQHVPGSPRFVALGLDAIIVPGTRPATYLDHAVTLARAASCRLVVLCSRQLRGTDVKEFLAARSFNDAIIIDLPEGYSHPLFDFRGLHDIKDELPPGSGYLTDLSMKRNIGLALAKMLGWKRVFFLDDDIRDIAYPDLQQTVHMLESFSAVGMYVSDFPDNSIVCHANRMTGAPQDVFVSGAALAMDCYSDIGFFPDIYNEDWFFFFDAASNGQLGNSYLSATQLYYYPFANPQRAAWQEFGDVLAEGLYALLHLGHDVEQATGMYWELFLDARRNFLESILTNKRNADPYMREHIAASVESALKCLLDIKPDLCESYIRLWRGDLRDWKRRMAWIPKVGSVDAALGQLGLETTPTDSTWKILHPMDEVVLPPQAAGPVTIPRFDTVQKMATSRRHPTAPFPDEARHTLPLPVVTDEVSRQSPQLPHHATGHHRRLHHGRSSSWATNLWSNVWTSVRARAKRW